MATGPTQNYGAQAGTMWRPRPVAAALVRAASTFGPLLIALLVGTGAAHWVPATRTGLPWPVWLLLVVGASTGVLVVLSRWLRALLPLSALLRLSLVLPDRVPGRFEVARRTWTPAALEETRKRVGEPEAVEEGAAQRLLALVGTLAGHDDRTRAHGERVQAYAALIGRELGLSDEDVNRLSWVALLHDVGKIHVPVEIINKDGRPTEEEWATLQQHPHHGGELVQPLRGWLGDWLDGVEQHHERWDGGGYPRGLAGEQVSLAARVIAVADTYDVITSARAYKKPMSAEQARAEITRCAGEQFDPEVVRAFLSIGIGRLRRIAGPATLLASLPGVGAAPAQALSTAASVTQTAGGQVAAAVLSAVVGVGAGSAAITAASFPAAAETRVSGTVATAPSPSDLPATATSNASSPSTSTAAPASALPAASSATTTQPTAPPSASTPTGPSTSTHHSLRPSVTTTPDTAPATATTAIPTATPSTTSIATSTVTAAPTAAPTPAPTETPTGAMPTGTSTGTTTPTVTATRTPTGTAPGTVTTTSTPVTTPTPSASTSTCASNNKNKDKCGH